MICISIAEKGYGACAKALEGAEFAEIRLDLAELGEGEVARLFSSGKKLMATCRPGMPDAAREKLLSEAIEAGAAYVDVEVEADDAYKRRIVERARARDCTVIVSYHNHSKTPLRAELDQIVEWCFASGADIAKIACMVKSDADSARLLGMLDGKKRLVVIGMGPRGRLVRVVAPLLGGEFTFAAASKGKETAEGQPTKDEIERAVAALEGLK